MRFDDECKDALASQKFGLEIPPAVYLSIDSRTCLSVQSYYVIDGDGYWAFILADGGEVSRGRGTFSNSYRVIYQLIMGLDCLCDEILCNH